MAISYFHLTIIVLRMTLKVILPKIITKLSERCKKLRIKLSVNLRFIDESINNHIINNAYTIAQIETTHGD